MSASATLDGACGALDSGPHAAAGLRPPISVATNSTSPAASSTTAVTAATEEPAAGA